jgi:hypothetical protein
MVAGVWTPEIPDSLPYTEFAVEGDCLQYPAFAFGLSAIVEDGR